MKKLTPIQVQDQVYEQLWDKLWRRFRKDLGRKIRNEELKKIGNNIFWELRGKISNQIQGDIYWQLRETL